MKPRSKEPATKHGFKDATTDPQTIRRWWSENPNYNVAIRTGEESNLLVLDVDEGGEQTLKSNRWSTPTTVIAKTGKGFHHYYKHSAETVIRTKIRAAAGLDIKADGGYVLAPPSKHPNGSVYEWVIGLEDAEVVYAPDWLLNLPDRYSEGITGGVEATISDGQRNSTLFSRARSLFRQGYDDVEVFNLLESVNYNRCKPPLEQPELVRIVESAGKYGRGEMYISKDDNGVGVLMSDVHAEKVEWLWNGRIPLGKLTILDGDPGLGKSVITMDLAARVTNGLPFPDGDVDHVGHLDHVDHLGGVVVLSAEDGLADTIRPRLDAAGANTTRIVAISTVPDREDNERTIAIP